MKKRKHDDVMSSFRTIPVKHVHAHEAVITNEYWYGDGPPLMHPSLSAGKTAERRVVIGEDPDLDGKRFRRTERGISLITRSMIAKLAT
jgi:glucose-1-phosphate adenylyltransferase